MSLSLAVALNVVFITGLLGLLAWFMSHPRKLTPHVSSRHPGHHLELIHEEARAGEIQREEQERIAA
jgi:hypothetical protein